MKDSRSNLMELDMQFSSQGTWWKTCSEIFSVMKIISNSHET